MGHSQGGTSILGGREARNFASEILVGAPDFASKNINDNWALIFIWQQIKSAGNKHNNNNK